MSSVLGRGVFAMSLASAVGLATTIAAYFIYSRVLTPAQFGLYAGALTLAKFGTILLDGGLKTALIKHPVEVDARVQRALFLGSSAAALAILALVCGGLLALHALGQVDGATAAFLGLYGAAYFTTYPLVIVPLAELERTQRYAPVAWSESVAIVLEYGLPALLWTTVAPGFWSFVVCAWLARALRSAVVLAAARQRPWLRRATAADWGGMRALFLEGLGLQLAVSVCLLRDSLHLVLVGPWFGREWVGLYAWALQLCAAASQVFALTAARVALPALRLTEGSAVRWQAALTQVAWLTLLTAPPLVFLTPAAAVVNETLFGGKWSAALALVPLLVARMLPGLATTPLGALLLAERGARSYALANAAWTAAEVIAAVVLLAWVGPRGLAWSYSFMAWFGVLMLVGRLPGPAAMGALLAPLLLRPSLWLALALLGLYLASDVPAQIHANLAAAAAWVAGGSLLCLASEARFRGWLHAFWQQHLRSA